MADFLGDWLQQRRGATAPPREPLESDLEGTVFDATDPIGAWKREKSLTTPAPSQMGPVGRAIGAALDWGFSPFETIQQPLDALRDYALESAVNDTGPMRYLKAFGGSLAGTIGDMASPLNIASFATGAGALGKLGMGARAVTSGAQIGEGVPMAIEGAQEGDWKQFAAGAGTAALGALNSYGDVAGAFVPGVEYGIPEKPPGWKPQSFRRGGRLTRIVPEERIGYDRALPPHEGGLPPGDGPGGPGPEEPPMWYPPRALLEQDNIVTRGYEGAGPFDAVYDSVDPTALPPATRPRTTFVADAFGNTRPNVAGADELENFLRGRGELAGPDPNRLLPPQAGMTGKGVPRPPSRFPWMDSNRPLTPAEVREAMELQGGSPLADLEAMLGVEGSAPTAQGTIPAWPEFGRNFPRPIQETFDVALQAPEASLQFPPDVPDAGPAAVARPRPRPGSGAPPAAAADPLGAAPAPLSPDSRSLNAGDPRQLPAADQSGMVEGRGDGDGALGGGLPEDGPVDPLAPFVRRTKEDNARRLADPAIRRELEQMLDEMESIPYESRNFNDAGARRGGDLEVSGGTGGTPLFYDILGEAPLNRGRNGQEVAAKVRGTRGDVIVALRAMLEGGDIPNNIAEGAYRLAKRRMAGDWQGLSPLMIPYRDALDTRPYARELPDEIPDELSKLIDEFAADEDKLAALERLIESGDPEAFGNQEQWRSMMGAFTQGSQPDELMAGGRFRDVEFEKQLRELEGALGGSTIEQVGDGPTSINASGDSAASGEAVSRINGMRDRGEQFVVYDRAGNRRPLIGPEAVDYVPRAGETYGVEGPNGFRALDDRGGRVSARPAEPTAAPAPAADPLSELLDEPGTFGDRPVQPVRMEDGIGRADIEPAPPAPARPEPIAAAADAPPPMSDDDKLAEVIRLLRSGENRPAIMQAMGRSVDLKQNSPFQIASILERSAKSKFRGPALSAYDELNELLRAADVPPDAPPALADVLETGELQPRIPGAEDVRKVGQADTTFKAPVQATGDDFADAFLRSNEPEPPPAPSMFDELESVIEPEAAPAPEYDPDGSILRRDVDTMLDTPEIAQGQIVDSRRGLPMDPATVRAGLDDWERAARAVLDHPFASKTAVEDAQIALGDLQKIRAMLDQAPDALSTLEDIATRHEVRNPGKADDIAESMKRVGWKGRPVLVLNDGGKRTAWTATHRLDAAKRAGLKPSDVPMLEIDAAKLRDAGYNLDELTQLGKKARIKALRDAGLDDAAELLEQERAASQSRRDAAADPDVPETKGGIPDNVRDFLVRQLKYTPEQVAAMDPDEAIRVGRERVMNPEPAQPVEAKPEAIQPLPERKQLPGFRNFDELRTARGIQRKELAMKAASRRDARLNAPKEPVSDGTPVRTPQERAAAGEQLTTKERQMLGLPEETRERGRVSLREQGNSPRQIERRVVRMKKWIDDPTPENFARWVEEVTGQAERYNEKQLKGGTGEAAPPKKDTATGEYLASGIFPGAQIFSDPALIKKLAGFLVDADPEARLVRAIAGGALGAWTNDDNRLAGMVEGALLGAYAGPIARGVARDFVAMLKGGRPKHLAEVYLQRGDRDLSLWERLVSPPASAIREHFEKVRPALAGWERVRQTGKVDSTMPLFNERFENVNAKGQPVIRQKGFLKPEISYLREQAKIARERKRPRLASYLEEYADDLAGVDTGMERKLKDLAGIAPKRANYVANEVANQIYRMGLAFNASSAIVNRISQPLLAAPYVGLRNLWKAYAPLSDSEKLLSDIHRPIDAEEMRVAATRTLAKFDEIASWMMRFTDNQNRQGVAAAAHLAAKQAGAPEAIAVKFARDVSEKTQGLIGIGTSNPSWRGPVMKMFKPFTKFPILLAEWANDIAVHPDPRVRFRTAAMLGAVYAFSQVTGLDAFDMLAGGARWGGSAILRGAMDAYGHMTNAETDHRFADFSSPSAFADSDLGAAIYPVGVKKTVDTARRFIDYGTETHRKRTPGGALDEVTPMEDALNYFGVKTTRQTERQRVLNEAYETEKRAQTEDSQASAQAKRDYLAAYDRGDEEGMTAALEQMGPNTRRSVIRSQDRDRFQRLLHDTPVKRRGEFIDNYGELERELGLR